MRNYKTYFSVLGVGLLLSASPVLAADKSETPAASPPAAAAAIPAAEPAVPASTKRWPAAIFDSAPAAKAAMDINPDRYAEFWKKWHFVSVRWREDSREIRLTYANDLAWKVLSEQKTEYPTGAMFGKLVYPAEEDLALPVSLLTANTLTRFMVMLWDPNHPKKGTDGWTYIRFINTPADAPRDKNDAEVEGVMTTKEVAACVECHKRAYDRGFVFSQPMYLFREPKDEPNWKEKKVLANRFEEGMKEMPANAVPRIVNSLMSSFPGWKDRKTMGYIGDFFIGSQGEIGPVMAKMAAANPNNIYMILDRDDPNTISLASSVKKKGYDKCAGLVRVQGAGFSFIGSGIGRGRDSGVNIEGGLKPVTDPKTGGYTGAREMDLAQQFRPIAALYVICDGKGVSRQALPLMRTEKDTDGLASYYFAPANVE
jgi:hypothetical protein